MKIVITEGILAEFKADVIVNSTNQGLKLNQGHLSSSLCQAAGPGLQDECTRKYPDPISFGEVKSTGGYNLKCKRVYHVALPHWECTVVEPQVVLMAAFYNILNEAHTERMTSVAMPTMGCGFLNYPPDIVAVILKHCTGMFEQQHRDTPVTQIYVVLFKKAKDWEHVQLAFRFQFSDKEEEQREARRLEETIGQGLSDTCKRESAINSCDRRLKCGHLCAGYKNELTCPACLDPQCCVGSGRQSGSDQCVICCDALSRAPVVNLACDHLYHLHCVKRLLASRWVGPRITFNFRLCPLCKKPINHPELRAQLDPILKLYDEVKRKALMRLQYEGLERCKQVVDRASPFYKKPAEFAMDRYCYYPCYKCKKPYFGGIAQCEAAMDPNAPRRVKDEDMVCPACSGHKASEPCKHGSDYIAYKCRYCCSVAVFFCFGTTHFCNACHNNYIMLGHLRDLPSCPAGPCGKQLRGKCPLGIQHPRTGQEFCIGCGLCKNLQTF